MSQSGRSSYVGRMEEDLPDQSMTGFTDLLTNYLVDMVDEKGLY